MKTRQFRLCDGVFVELQCGSPANTGSGVLWTEMTYTDAAEILADAQRLEIDKELLEFFVSADASFVSTESDALLQLSTRTVSLEEERLRYASMIFHVTECEILTVESAHSGIGELVRAGWPSRAAVHGVQPWHILAVFLDEFAESYLPVIESVEDQVLHMEEHLAEAPLTAAQVSSLFRTRRQLILLQRVVEPLSRLVARIVQSDELSRQRHAPDFRPARDELIRLESRVNGLWKVITSVVEMSNLLEQQRQGNATRMLSAWAAIVAVPTALASVFGMNFSRMPGIDSDTGHWVALAGMAVAASGLYLRFRRIGWL